MNAKFFLTVAAVVLVATAAAFATDYYRKDSSSYPNAPSINQ